MTMSKNPETARVAVIDYGMGNLRSVAKALEMVGASVDVTSNPKALAGATHVVLPGVGAFRDAIHELKRRDFVGPIREVIEKGVPFLGICLGLQLLFESSSEDGFYEGLAILPGDVTRFPSEIDGQRLTVPHMGWNQIHVRRRNALLEGIPDGSYVYFVHSYYVRPARTEDIAAETDYGIMFCSMVNRENLYATQFHPEKSQRIGLQILRNFVAQRKGFESPQANV